MSFYNDCCELWRKAPLQIDVWYDPFNNNNIIIEVRSHPKASFRWEYKYNIDLDIDHWESHIDWHAVTNDVASDSAVSIVNELRCELFEGNKLPSFVEDPIIDQLTDHILTPLLLKEWKRRHPYKFNDVVKWKMSDANT